MLRLMSDMVPALLACCDGMLKNFDLRWYADAALTVVMAAKGYPGAYAKGSVIEGLDAAAAIKGVEIFHAGTLAQDGRILANGGRVLRVWATRQANSRGPGGAPPRGGRIARWIVSAGAMVSAGAISDRARLRERRLDVRSGRSLSRLRLALDRYGRGPHFRAHRRQGRAAPAHPRPSSDQRDVASRQL